MLTQRQTQHRHIADHVSGMLRHVLDFMYHGHENEHQIHHHHYADVP